MTMCSRDMVYQIHSKGKRISITLRKQPDPDWKPDESELVGKKSKPIELGKNIHSNNEADRPKKKAISGAAKRRKKMMKQRGQMGDNNANKFVKKDSSNKKMFTPQNVTGKSNATQPKPPGAKKKDNDKQARRNARGLLKKSTNAKPDEGVK